MPTYEYACKTCGEHLEVVQSFKDNALTDCPACGGPLRKVFGNIGVAFKGSGFYKTDSRSDGHKGASKVPERKSGEGSSEPGQSSAAASPTKSDGAAKSGDGASTPKDSAPKSTTPASAAAAAS
jgi:putative FmdB family regulatory protein